MAWGFRRWDGRGSLSIGDDASSYFLRHKLNVTTNDTSPFFTGSFATVTVAAVRPMPFFQAQQSTINLGQRNNGDGTWSISFWTRAPFGSSFPVFIFDLAEAVPSQGGWGVEVYKSPGKKAWFLGGKPLIVRAFSNAPSGLPSDRTYAVRASRLNGYGQTYEYNFTNNVNVATCWNGVVTYGVDTWNAGRDPTKPPFGSWSSGGDAPLIVIDVTGY